MVWNGRCIGQSFPNFNVHVTPLKILLNADSDSIGLGWSLRFYFSKNIPGDADAAGSWSLLLVERHRA